MDPGRFANARTAANHRAHAAAPLFAATLCAITSAGFGRLGRTTDNPRMTKIPDYRGYRFPGEIIERAVWLRHRFTLGFCNVEDLLAERGITVSTGTPTIVPKHLTSLIESRKGRCALLRAKF